MQTRTNLCCRAGRGRAIAARLGSRTGPGSLNFTRGSNRDRKCPGRERRIRNRREGPTDGVNVVARNIVGNLIRYIGQHAGGIHAHPPGTRTSQERRSGGQFEGSGNGVDGKRRDAIGTRVYYVGELTGWFYRDEDRDRSRRKWRTGDRIQSAVERINCERRNAATLIGNVSKSAGRIHCYRERARATWEG